jgi:hypothetical protein
MKQILLFLLPLVFFTSCQINSKRIHELNSNAPLVDPKYSIAKDREELDQLRESMPPELKKRNDEKALMAELMGELKFTPELVREKFSNLVRKKRDLFNKDMTKAREDFTKNEKKIRDDFYKNLEEERKDFLRKKVDRERRASFFNDQDEARKTFVAEQREARDEYEADAREKRKNFEDYVKEKNDEFNAELKDYTLKWKEKDKAKQRIEDSAH